ncbi:MAG: hypothetical protein JW885_02400 [Deltaproteobacteria bacterium]|nr:hypothetical protein [Candidatus Zymogenaceae bacterium]
MEYKKVTWEGYEDCYRCVVGDAELIITTGFGPRILSLSTKGTENILFVDTGKTLGRGDWRLYGGHRLWIAPETETTYAPDNDGCLVETGDDFLSVLSRDECTGIKKTITIVDENGLIRVDHTITNEGDTLIPGAVWALTCVNNVGTAFFPWGTGGSWDLKKVVYWHRWMDHASEINDTQFTPTDDLFLVTPAGREGKVGSACREGFIGVSARDFTFVKTFERMPVDSYPDDNCAAECYTGPYFTELETLSPLVTFSPGEPLTHSEHWLVAPHCVDPADGAEVREFIARLRG